VALLTAGSPVRRLVTTAALIGAVCVTSAQTLEYEVKAGFLYNFTKFIEWPAAAFSGAGDPFRICLAGSDPFGSVLERTIQGDSVGSHPMTVDRVAGAADAGSCHLLFVSRDVSARAPAFALAYPHALIVGESPGFLLQGGTINFVIEAGRVRFDVNVAAAVARGLQISSRLLRIARDTSGQAPEGTF
jgi:hypothetical protein